MSFVHLHTHSHYSLLQGLSKIEGLVDAAKKDKMPALALTDHGNLYGAVKFYKACKKAEIKPIIGADIYIAENSMKDTQPGSTNRTFHLVLLAETSEGYKNLIRLLTEAHLEGFYNYPRADKALLKKYSEGLIALSGDIQGEVPRALWNKDEERAKELVQEYKAIFGDNNFFIEISHHPHLERHDEIMEGLVKVAKETKTPLVAGQGSYYLTPEDKEAHRTLLGIQSSHATSESARFFSAEEDYSFIDTKTAKDLFKGHKEAIENTVKIAERCNADIEPPGWVFPLVELEEGKTADEQLREYAYKGLEDRGMEKTKEVIDRLEYELDTIKQKGFSPYFLVVADLLYYARKHNILTTIRGSVAGSLVTYLTKITTVDPIEYMLPFERFLNPQRPSAPDIDMDFADDRRDEVIEYAKEKYGEDKVAQIGTFGTMLARGVVRDTARALGYPYGAGDRIAKMIPFGSQGFPMTIEKALDLEPDLKEAYENDREVTEIIDMARKIEGNARHCSVHAAGVVMAPEPLTEYVPLQREQKGNKIITQYDMHDVEEVGLIKFDFLGIRNLSILAHAVGIVEKTLGEKVDIENVPLDDKKVFEILSRGETMGLFQLNGAAMTRFLIDLKPTTIHDINAMIALYRPGPMKNIPDYIARKHGKQAVSYYHPKMKNFLERSYGILVYQDDLLSAALELAGYTWETVDKFRKAVGKKIPEEMAKQHKIFVEGCQKHSGMSKKEAEGLWDLFEPFQGYGFNKAHAASYGKVAYQTAYMKANYPSEYMTAVLTAESGDVEEIARIVNECKRMELEVLPPDVNESFGGFTVLKDPDGNPKDDKIRFGLYTIKNLGEEISNVIISERKKNGPYKSYQDFLERVRHQNLNKRSLEALIKSGSLDNLGERGQMLANLESVLAYSRDGLKQLEDQTSLFGLMEDDASLPQLRLEESEPASADDKLGWEKELLGLYLSGHPLDKHKKRFEGKKTIKDYLSLPSGVTALCGGIIEEVRTVTTKKGERMAFVRMADFDTAIEVVFFPSSYQKFKEHLVPDMCVAIKGRISNRNQEKSMVAEAIKLL
ncbi:DNA polymerase III subunit alpha [bacterium]|nr:DNA polymerase III subunit alpha [bacterium]|tara:strand:- start:18160 stop:21345 length:3186 start_codon:yes stop_codon:yes gene_type:complete